MKKFIFLSSFAVCVLLLFAGRGQAVIYQYMNEKGDPCLVDDMQKVPEQFRPSAKMVSGEVTTERTEEDRQRDAKMIAERQQTALQGRVVLKEQNASARRQRFIWSGIITAGFVVGLMILANVHALRRHPRITGRVRIVLIASLVISLGILHGRDLLGLFGRAQDTVQDVQDRQAERGRKAAEFYKAVDQILDQKAAEDAAKEQRAEERR